MNANSLNQRLAVCSWSLQPTTPEDLIAKLRAVGIGQIQLALDPLRTAPEVWHKAPEMFRENGITVVSGMFGCVGEDYSTLQTIRLTGGFVPDATWEENWRNVGVTVALAQMLSLKLVTFHAGLLPHEKRDPSFEKLKRRLIQFADAFRMAGIVLGLETGQETASNLLALLQTINHPNLCVNFDPANMLLYDQGDPIEAVRLLGPWIRQVHIKDAIRTSTPGAWGEEVVVGTGEVNWPEFFSALTGIGFKGFLCIEREAGNQRVKDLRTTHHQIQMILSQSPTLTNK